jgi:tetratricopeptide (TPR) repeat protein
MFGERWLKTAYSYLYIRDFARATESFRRAIECEPENPTYYFHASLTALRNGYEELAMQWAETAVLLAPGNASYQEHLGVVRGSALAEAGHVAYRDGRYAEAKQLFQRALSFDPLNDEAVCALDKLGYSGEFDPATDETNEEQREAKL